MMDNSLLIWQYLRPLLENNDALKPYFGIDVNNPENANKKIEHIFPLVALEGTPYPFIVYRRDNVTPEYSKHLPGVNGWTNNVSFSLSVYSDNYDDSANIANIVRDILEDYRLENESIKIDSIELVSTYEAYSENGFMQTLTFSTTAV